MASKQAVTTKKASTKPAAPAAAPAAATKAVRVAKPKAPRVSSAKHSKTAAPEPAIAETVVNTPIAAARIEIDPHVEISKIAYGYWLSRGCQGGNQHEDWLRAEREFYSAK